MKAYYLCKKVFPFMVMVAGIQVIVGTVIRGCRLLRTVSQ